MIVEIVLTVCWSISLLWQSHYPISAIHSVFRSSMKFASGIRHFTTCDFFLFWVQRVSRCSKRACTYPVPPHTNHLRLPLKYSECLLSFIIKILLSIRATLIAIKRSEPYISARSPKTPKSPPYMPHDRQAALAEFPLFRYILLFTIFPISRN